MKDQMDIIEENPIINNGKKLKQKHQNHPEFSQTSYLRIRYNEEAFLPINYIENFSKNEKKI